MSDDPSRLSAFEARLAQLKQRMEAGLSDRAQQLRGAARRLRSDEEAARSELKTLSHKLRGIAGTYGHQHLTELAGKVEQRARASPLHQLLPLALELANAAEEAGRAGASPSQELRDSLRPGALTASSPPPGSVPPKAGTSLRVLAMDDDPVTLRLLSLTLGQVGGFDATVVDSARVALQKLETQRYDVIISDAMMPDMNGRDFCAAARAMGGHCAEVPIIILSAATADELGWLTHMDGPTTWLRKPFSPSSLVKDVERIAAEHGACKREP